MRELEPIVEGLLYDTESMLVAGASGAGKSLFTYALCKAVSSYEGEFLGQPCATGKTVLYLDGEMHINSIGRRVKTLGGNNNIGYYSKPNSNPDLDLTLEEHRDAIIDAVIAGGYDIVVLDSVRTLFNMADENSAASWQPLNQLVPRLRDLGAVVIVVHHANKGAITGGTVMFAGSTNAVTTVDRDITINKAGEFSFTVNAGSKQGRSEHGFGSWVDCTSYTVDAENQCLLAENSIDAQLKELRKFAVMLSKMKQGDSYNLKKGMQKFNAMFGLKVGNNVSGKLMWPKVEYLFEGDNEFGVSDLESFTEWFKKESPLPLNDVF
ncbi:AAA family ATPase [Shewanella maritima]|nr:AAA family ATPase [Shewanella maritima]